MQAAATFSQTNVTVPANGQTSATFTITKPTGYTGAFLIQSCGLWSFDDGLLVRQELIAYRRRACAARLWLSS